MSFIVQRLPGDKPGPSISSSLLVDDLSKISRGKAEINARDSDRALIDIEMIDKDPVLYGSHIHLINPDSTVKGGIITSFSYTSSYSKDKYTVQSSFSVEALV